MELVERLEAKNAPGHINIIDTDTTEELLDLLTEAAACIREMVESQSGGYVPAAPDDQGFVPWSGGENPCPGGRVDAVWLGEIHHDQASDDLEWAHSGICDHITSYRILPPAP